MYGPAFTTQAIFLYVLALFIPPVPVYIKKGLSWDVGLNVVLWFCGWIPGVAHAWYTIARNY
ncbi:uncharacterized protein EHS24_002177 [Apiotrichum porosum]|uniref:Plasma membrane proteolipid Pmp3 n=1 Tax=Apiotrichum porosum TaxID=105984 RepID=A0A427XHY6_9TREE|nr:uncharacterized protein EHS24_002177 [Apiotrichum porosum]RSH78452.1 hypothetical protein EHS24_002177 [Apiotrichum porosum]